MDAKTVLEIAGIVVGAIVILIVIIYAVFVFAVKAIMSIF